MPVVSLATNATAVTGIATSYAANKVIALTSSPTTDTASLPVLANGGYAACLIINGTGDGVPAPSSGNARITSDIAGDVAVSAEAAFTWLPGVTAPTSIGIVIPFDEWYRTSNPTNAVRTWYLFIKVNQGTLAVAAGGAKLVAHDGSAVR